LFAYELTRSNAIYVAFLFSFVSILSPCYAYFNTKLSATDAIANAVEDEEETAFTTVDDEGDSDVVW